MTRGQPATNGPAGAEMHTKTARWMPWVRRGSAESALGTRSMVFLARCSLPKPPRTPDFAVIAGATDVVGVVPLVGAAKDFAVTTLLGDAQVNEPPGQATSECGSPTKRCSRH